MGWRDDYKVHPAADVFPMMSDAELVKLGEDIKANRLTSPISFFVPEHVLGATIEYVMDNGVLADGRNRLEAMERAGINLTPCAVEAVNINAIDPVAFILGRNIRRRHLSKQKQADLIVAAVKAGEKLDQVEPVSRGGRSKINKVKAKAIAEARKLDISESTVKRSLAKADGGKRMPRYRRTPVEIERDMLIRRLDFLDVEDVVMKEPSDAALELLPLEQIAWAIGILKSKKDEVQRLIGRLVQQEKRTERKEKVIA